MKRLRTALLSLAALALCLPLLFGLRLAQYVHVERDVAPVRIEVVAGASAGQVARQLLEAGVGDWPRGNRWGMRLWGEPGKIKAGAYRFEGKLRLVDVFDDLSAGRMDLVAVTLPEGLTAREMAPLLEQAGITDAQTFVAIAYDPASPERWDVPGPSLEGFLYPDTYRFARGLPAETIIGTMVARTTEVEAEFANALAGSGLDRLQWVTLASIVEKETGKAEERPLIASVFLNRLDKGMRLETDPTVIYGIQDFDGNIRRADLRRDTPYNTYTRKGLPPGPIASPGRESLRAVLFPEISDYLYFVSRNDGSHQFSVTYEEHRQAVDHYQLRRRR